MRDTRADIEIDWVPVLRDAAGPLARILPEGTPRPVPIVPSSLRQDDQAVNTIREALRERDLRTTVLVPRSATALLTRRSGSAWHAAEIDGRHWRVDARLTATLWIAVMTIDAGSHTGPFALDLPARFMHPADRVRLAARPDRLRALADIAAIAPPAACLILTPAAGGWLAVTTRDPIAAELWALGLAERFHATGLEMQGLWEEPTVQRATELELGIRIPNDMRVATNLPPDNVVARSLLDNVAERLGISPDPDQATG